MGVYIKGMEMPRGKEVTLRIDEKGEVYVYGNYPTELYRAIRVPPHGRLIDAGTIQKAIQDYGKGAIEDRLKSLDPVDDIVNIACIVDYVPTIIPAEEDSK